MHGYISYCTNKVCIATTPANAGSVNPRQISGHVIKPGMEMEMKRNEMK